MAFSFKQFSLHDSNCAMKVGTDSVLLGAFANYTDNNSVLDIGTGCGLLALMAAQESSAFITAIDIDRDACEQASQNFTGSPWPDRLTCIHSGLKEYIAANPNQTFDHIISNPPYFTNSLKSNESQRNTARHNDELPLKDLVESAAKLLNPQGKLSIVLPCDTLQHIHLHCIINGLNQTRQLSIIPKSGKIPNRILLEFIKAPTPTCQSTELTIRDAEGCYTEEYKRFTREFYLDF